MAERRLHEVGARAGVVVWSGMTRLSLLPETNWPFWVIAEDCLPMLLALSFAFGDEV